MENKTEPKIIVAIDANTRDQAYEQVSSLDPKLCHLKIGNILFTRYGPLLVEELMQKGYQIFLDLKFHDIPQTVIGACRMAALLGVWMINVHILGGRAMLEAVVDSLQNLTISNKPLLIGVTVLTSLDSNDLKTLGMNEDLSVVVSRMANLAKESGLDGVVCSAHEASALRKQLGSHFLLVTPGIRLEIDQQHDQKRTITPEAAIKAGSDYLVIGRSITYSRNRKATLQRITNSIKKLT
ncbi:Orotidine 5'-phosphate decarboxylase [Coxiella-like endosymbiont]|uniref:orotidine-5'-phosphate decarboxylase n=1 Tax=Coxiella-like endosymbiont TaxID=1592897 RepID=UPI000C7FDEB9|nr:orotidine-5'-phosphate decarboxylase [Coxiella-like endosymbiont]PMB55007.1 Orotidine 5'-phosphate decarboxylase [Coxiella-like endosymbiont]